MANLLGGVARLPRRRPNRKGVAPWTSRRIKAYASRWAQSLTPTCGTRCRHHRADPSHVGRTCPAVPTERGARVRTGHLARRLLVIPGAGHM